MILFIHLIDPARSRTMNGKMIGLHFEIKTQVRVQVDTKEQAERVLLRHKGLDEKGYPTRVDKGQRRMEVQIPGRDTPRQVTKSMTDGLYSANVGTVVIGATGKPEVHFTVVRKCTTLVFVPIGVDQNSIRVPWQTADGEEIVDFEAHWRFPNSATIPSIASVSRDAVTMQKVR